MKHRYSNNRTMFINVEKVFTYFDKLRKLDLHRKYFVTLNIIKFKDLLTSTSFETLNMLTIFIKEILNVCSS